MNTWKSEIVWYSTADRLPDECEYVLVADAHGDVFIAELRGDQFMVYAAPEIIYEPRFWAELPLVKRGGFPE